MLTGTALVTGLLGGSGGTVVGTFINLLTGMSNGLGTSFQGTVTLGIDTLINNLIAGLS